MRLMKKLTAFMTAAILCLGSVMPAYADFYRQPSNIKGVLINSESEVADVVEVGASQVVCNFPMSWAFQPNMMNAYGSFLRAMDNAGITVTMIVLNDWNAAAYKPELLPVSAPVAGVSYYGFNTLNEQGVQAIRDTAGILTNNFGNLVSNWVIGNEVNDGQVWNYLGSMDIDTYCSNYATSFRTWYDTIKASNSLARVYMPFDFRWNCGQLEGFKYGVMDMLPRLNALLKDTDYGIAWHAYPETFTDPVFSDDIHVLDTPDTYIINLKNLHAFPVRKGPPPDPLRAGLHLRLSGAGRPGPGAPGPVHRRGLPGGQGQPLCGRLFLKPHARRAFSSGRPLRLRSHRH